MDGFLITFTVSDSALHHLASDGPHLSRQGTEHGIGQNSPKYCLVRDFIEFGLNTIILGTDYMVYFASPNKSPLEYKGNNIFLDTICHSDDRREEDVLLSVAKNLGNTHFMITRFFASL